MPGVPRLYNSLRVKAVAHVLADVFSDSRCQPAAGNPGPENPDYLRESIMTTQLTRRLALAAGTTLAAASAANVAAIATHVDSTEQSPFAVAAAALADDRPCTETELAAIDFEAIPEFGVGADGIGPGSPDTRKAIDQNLRYLAFWARSSFGIVGQSKLELIENANEVCEADEGDAAIELVEELGKAADLAKFLAEIIRAAELRTLCALANCCVEAVQS